MSSSTLDLIAIVDVETTGLNPTQYEVIELGCVLFSLSHNTVLQQVSTLVPVSVDANPVERINGISAGAARLAGSNDGNSILHSILDACLRADALVAHNASFDQEFLECFINAEDYAADYPLLNKHWIDTMAINWPRAIRQGCNLTDLALAYGVPVWSNHRALTDCQLLAHIIQREPTAAQLLARELEPKVWATWKTTKDDKDGQAKAKSAGFRWNRPGCPANYVWSRLMHPDDVAELGFDVVTMDAA